MVDAATAKAYQRKPMDGVTKDANAVAEKLRRTEEETEFPGLIDIKKSLPAEYFESSLAMSMYYVVRAFVITMVFMTTLYHTREYLKVHQTYLGNHYFFFDTLACATYLFLQGVVFWGFFTIGHDCGHSSFSRYPIVNFVMGNIMHSLILTPFESWRITHRTHHKNTGHMDNDEIFFPQREKISAAYTRYSIFLLPFAWTIYLIQGVYPRNVHHFNPFDEHFASKKRSGAVALSLGFYVAVVVMYYKLTMILGLPTMLLYVFGPIMVFASFLVVVTFLHHNDEATPWYGDEKWSYVKGNLSSVDRSYGWLINNLSHNIGTHQIHHLFPIIPHYKLVDATKAFNKQYPELARKSDKPIIPAFIETVMLFGKYGWVEENVQLFSLGMQKAAQTKQH
jgi:omega-3 fatty acid desaturase (delta-15 desaturase)